MALKYERSGGFAGFRDELLIEGQRLLQVSRRGAVTAKRELAPAEVGQLEALLSRALAAPPSSPASMQTPDAFRHVLTLDGEAQPRVDLTTPILPGPEEPAGPWVELLAWLERLIDQA